MRPSGQVLDPPEPQPDANSICSAGVGLLALGLARGVVLVLTDAGVARLTESAGPSARSRLS
jgi:hypothetical protein